MAIRIGYLAQLRHDSIEKTERIFRAVSYIEYTNTESFERRVNQEWKRKRRAYGQRFKR